MWVQLTNLPPVLVGQIILTCLDLKSIVTLEAAVANREQLQILRSLFSYYTEFDVEINIPQEIAKLKWLQDHDFAIRKARVNLDQISATFETKLINEIILIDKCLISSKSLSYLPDSCYEKVFSAVFNCEQNANLMEVLFSRLVNLRELTVHCLPDGWIKGALKRLYEESNNNVLIEKIYMFVEGSESESSVVEIARYCPRLQSLWVWFKIDEDSLLALSKHCPLLKKLFIQCIPRLSTVEIAALCAPALSCIQDITTPYLLADNDTSQYARTIPYLTSVKCVYANGRRDHILLPLISQYCVHLEEVTIGKRSSATLTQLLQLVQNYPSLHTISLCNPFFYTDEIVIGLAQRCTNLHSFSLAIEVVVNTTNITDASLLALSEHCPKLQKLQLQYCTQITETAILLLVQQCKHLNFLAIPDTVLSEDTVFGVPFKERRKLSSFIMYTFDR